ncbi:MAG TPA: M24 family metallopeptidase [Thermomicrobiales bacterium]|nr:M24 family metallopeptidase [Thermomicrobiales bacterium]
MAGTVDTGATGEARRAAFAAALRERVLPLRAQAEVRNDWLRQRLETILPDLLAREGFDMWIVAAREYNEDPVIMTLLPEPSMAARRRTILVFCRRPDGGVDRFTLDRYGFGDFYAKGWDPDAEDQDAALARLVRERDPQSIGLNISETFAFGDGLTHHEYTQLMAALGPTYGDRVHGAERLCVGWLERRIPAELAVYPDLVALGHDLIAEMFSPRTIRPGITTTEDVVWWLRQTMQDAGLRAWFQPSISIQARGRRFDDKDAHRAVILPGDVLHCDVGFYYLGLATDQQQHAYVLRPGETDAPAGLRDALAAANRLQEIHLDALAVGRTGNEVLHAALARAREEGLTPSVYSHPLGYHGHAAGPTIGLWDQQEGVPGRGDYEIFDDTCYSIELNARHPVPEWDGQEVRIALEEDAALSGGAIAWLHGRQTRFYLI